MTVDPVEPLPVKNKEVVSIVDLDLLTGKIWQDLHGQVPRERVRQVLLDLLPKYQDVRILTYVPILLQRNAIEILRH
jgi:hypothetical protein